MMEEEQEEPSEPLEFDLIEKWANEVGFEFQKQTGAMLPRITNLPKKGQKVIKCDFLDTEIPLGSLFYPCCGSDISDPVDLFRNCVTAFYFADPYNPPKDIAQNNFPELIKRIDDNKHFTQRKIRSK